MRRLTFTLVLSVFAILSWAQTNTLHSQSSTRGSVRPIPEEQMAFKRTIWLRMNLQWKANHPFFAKNHELSRIILESVREGNIRPFASDSLISRLDEQTFIDRITFTEEDNTVGDTWEDNSLTRPIRRDFRDPRDFYVLRLKMNVYFDQRRSRMIHDILALNIYLPAEKDPANLERFVASFSYKELVEEVFSKNPRAIWYNEKNPAAHLRIDHAFDLRIFQAHIDKVENGQDTMLLDTEESGRAAFLKGQEFEHWLVEYESQLWEY